MTDSVTVQKAVTAFDLAQCVQIRTIVFVVGQGVPAAREIDEHENDCTYFIARLNGEAAGTVRWRKYNDHTAKIERLAVLETARGRKLAERLTVAAMEDIERDQSITTIRLGAQTYIMPLYEKFGFVADGPEYMDGGTIPHQDMVKRLRP